MIIDYPNDDQLPTLTCQIGKTDTDPNSPIWGNLDHPNVSLKQDIFIFPETNTIGQNVYF